jgi:serine/threonine protein kinase
LKLQSRYDYNPERDLLGKGGFARVYRARDELLHREVALKVFSTSGKHGYTVLDEIRKVIQLEHPNLLRYYDVLLLDQANALGEKEQLQIGVMEYANGGDLKAYARAHPGSPMLIKLLKQVLLGLEYLHGKGIIHRDLKAANILLVLDDKGEPTAKISDFGISKDMGAGQQSSSMMVGTIEYMAPEQFSPAKYGIDGKVGTNVDLWAFGVMVHELLLDSTPFGGRDGDTTVEQIMASILSTEQPKDIERLPEPYRSVVKRCLVANAKERIRKAAELIAYLEGVPSPKPLASAADSKAQAETKVYPTPPSAESTRTVDPQAETKALQETWITEDSLATSVQAVVRTGTFGGRLKKHAMLASVPLVVVVLLAAGALWHRQNEERLHTKQQTEAAEKRRSDAEAEAKARAEAIAKTEADIQSFYDANQLLFRQRAIYHLREWTFRISPSDASRVVTEISKANDYMDVVNFVDLFGIKISQELDSRRPAEEINREDLFKLSKVAFRRPIAMQDKSGNLVMVAVLKREPAPISIQQARGSIEPLLIRDLAKSPPRTKDHQNVPHSASVVPVARTK